jgi:hypothetical protein
MIDSPQRDYISQILRKRRDFLQFVGIAIGLAFGVDLLSNALTRVLPVAIQAAIGGAAVFTVACILGWWTFRSISFIRIVEGCIFLDTNSDALCSIPRYAFAEDVASVLATGLAASSTIRERWQAGVKHIDNGETKYPWLRKDALSLVTDAVEVVLFDYLSTSLSQTLKRYEGDLQNIDKVSPSAFPGMAFGNVFMAVDERTKQLHLTLPARSGLIRPAPNVLVLYSPRFQVKMKIGYNGAGASLPASVLGENFAQPQAIKAHAVDIFVQCDVPLSALLRTRHWEHYRWLGVFLNKLDQAEYARPLSSAYDG